MEKKTPTVAEIEEIALSLVICEHQPIDLVAVRKAFESTRDNSWGQAPVADTPKPKTKPFYGPPKPPVSFNERNFSPRN